MRSVSHCDLTITKVSDKKNDLSHLLPSENVRFMRCLDQQLTLSGKVRRLESETKLAQGACSRASKRLEMCMDNINTFKNDCTVRNVNREINNELKGLVKSRTKSRKCKSCGKIILNRFINDHEIRCVARTTGPGLPPLNCLLEPQSPRNLRVRTVGHNFLELQWDDPLVIGGSCLYDYHISLARAFYCIKGKKIVLIKKLPISIEHCSIWCKKFPIPANIYRIDGLDADTTYEDIQIRCRNQTGWSPWSNSISAKTRDPQRPTAPNFVSIKACTSSTLHLLWSPPFDEGGSPICSYEINFNVLIQKISLDINNNTSAEKTVENERKIRISGVFTECVLTDVPGDTLFRSLRVIARNRAGFSSLEAFYPDIRTSLPTTWYLTKKEIERVSQLTCKYIDSDFFHGTVQRKVRLEYINELKIKFSGLIPDAVAKDRRYSKDCTQINFSSLSSSIVEPKAEIITDINQSQPSQTYFRKFAQYQFRIGEIKRKICYLQDEKELLRRKRVQVSCDLEDYESRILALQLELERVLRFEGQKMSSNIIHGNVDQSFNVEELTSNLSYEIEHNKQKIEKWKYQQVHDLKKEEQTSCQLEKEIEMLKEREAAFLHFKQNTVERPNRSLLLYSDDLLRGIFSKWTNHIKKRIQEKTSITRISSIFVKIFLTVTWTKWFTVIRFFDSTESPVNIAIKKAEALFSENINNASIILKEVNFTQKYVRSLPSPEIETKYTHEYVNESLEQRISRTFDVTFICLGDGFLSMSRYDDAIECYKKQYHTIETSRNSDDFLVLWALIYCRVGKVFLMQSRWNEAYHAFKRQMSIAESCFDKCLKASALIGIGASFLGLARYHEAAKIYEESLILFNSMSDQCGKFLAHNGLKMSLDSLGDFENAKKHLCDANSIEFSIQRKIQKGLDMTSKLMSRLLRSSAVIDKSLQLEKSSLSLLSLRQHFTRKTDSLQQKRDDLKRAEDDLIEQKSLKKVIQQELAGTEHANSNTVLSTSLLHGSAQMIKSIELRRRLERKASDNSLSLIECEEKIVNLNSDIANEEDDLRALEDDVELEKGTLMKKVMSSLKYRCIALNANNIQGNNVLGDCKDGFEFLAASHGKIIYLHNLKSGLISYVFGDLDLNGKSTLDCKGHSGIVTSLYFQHCFIYSGSTDKTIICWDIEKKAPRFCARGHEGTVLSIHVNENAMVSGGVDKSIIIWDKESGKMRKRVRGHLVGVNSILCGATWILSGDVKGHIYFWTHSTWDVDKYEHTLRIKKHLFEHGSSRVNVVRKGSVEVACGYGDGTIILWWLKSGDIIYKVKAHEQSVSDMQMDSTRIVSCSLDMTIQVIDAINGIVIQTLRGGHKNFIMSLAFDSNTILSVCIDGVMRCWRWVTRENNLVDRTHVFEIGETLLSVSKKFNVSLNDLIEWNDINTGCVSQSFVGKNLIVGRADPNIPTVTQEVGSQRDKCNVRYRYHRNNGSVKSTTKHLAIDNRKLEYSKSIETINSRAVENTFGSIIDRMLKETN